MDWWIPAIIAVLGVGLWIAVRRGWVDLTNKTGRGGSTAGGALHIGDEVFAPSRHEAQVELDRQTVLPAPAPVAGDGDFGIAADPDSESRFDGTIRIDV